MNTHSSAPLSYHGEKGPLFSLAFKTALLTLITLGIYRFWQKTRIRKYIWSSIDMGGDRLEYTGTGLEKLLGFFIAVLFLAVYLGAIQMGLFYFGFSMMVDPQTASYEEMIGYLIAIYASFFAVLPFLLFAVYRARRYKMARTRFRGIRFGMDNGAWGYVGRALLYWLLSILTLFILSPLAMFKLEKYMADRSYYGSGRIEQGGKWTALYKYALHMFIGIVLLAGGAGAGAALQNEALMIIGMVVGYIWFFVGITYFQIRSFAYLMENKTLNGEIGFTCEPKTGTVIKHYIVGGLIVGLIIGVIAAILGAGVSIIAGAMLSGGNVDPMMFTILPIIIGVVIYLPLLVLAQALALVFITQPIIAHIVETTAVTNADALNRITQRETERGVDADGFADALDVGGAI
ncbi:hypothetical protein TRP8649_03833 [Pelagimonas phthalicica]|uniref:DUF898 domain-containing protein n=1 Tax=Pelagimonas phthalicica TaxID=1037362 RepID=A0A238JGW9_9RHOB|nr:DUF898 family protein [Pelagimonas phthalicica]TDS89130.1 uncharacterized membrane protein YjgN (DUF898 family) [Pelagimonas phthalicica]SMX29695.1 hypothetical protein TRP8649_03833 [Pelagimonas phthalicica]